jgi:hypothetical protein
MKIKNDPLLTIPLSEIKPLSKAESKRREMEYRRGYCDGWILAVESMRPGKLYNQLFDFWENELHDWQHQEPKDKMIEAPLPKKGLVK